MNTASRTADICGRELSWNDILRQIFPRGSEVLLYNTIPWTCPHFSSLALSSSPSLFITVSKVNLIAFRFLQRKSSVSMNVLIWCECFSWVHSNQRDEQLHLRTIPINNWLNQDPNQISILLIFFYIHHLKSMSFVLTFGFSISLLISLHCVPVSFWQFMQCLQAHILKSSYAGHSNMHRVQSTALCLKEKQRRTSCFKDIMMYLIQTSYLNTLYKVIRVK